MLLESSYLYYNEIIQRKINFFQHTLVKMRHAHAIILRKNSISKIIYIQQWILL